MLRFVPNPKTLEESVADEVDAFSVTKCRGKFLEEVYQALLLIKPSTIVNEQTFSIYFCSKVRSRLDDHSLSDLVYLKYHFLKLV